jgi:hypothetical protein
MTLDIPDTTNDEHFVIVGGEEGTTYHGEDQSPKRAQG